MGLSMPAITDRQGGRNPLVSFCIKFYNHAAFCRPALKAAFAQTYSPLEIIVTDDGSTDGTGKIVSAMIDEYVLSGGKHKVVKLFNDENLGITQTAQRQFKAAKGVLIVQADGDDISFPERVERIVSCWRNDGCRAGFIIHDALDLSLDGERVLQYHPKNSLVEPLGAASAYSSKVVSSFGDVDVRFKTTSEDMIYLHRGWLVGGCLHIREPLIYYRKGSGLTSAGTQASCRIYVSRAALDGVRQVRKDIAEKRAEGSVAPDVLLRVRRNARLYALSFFAEGLMYSADRMRARARAWRVMAHTRGFSCRSVFGMELALMNVPPRWIAAPISCLLNFHWMVKRLMVSRKACLNMLV